MLHHQVIIDFENMETSDIVQGVELENMEADHDDRISKLPDNILHHILSLITMPESVATSMLSTRWKRLWKHVPKLTFDDTLPPFYCCKRNSQNVRFANFVNNVLASYVPEVLQKLFLSFYEDNDIHDVGRWVSDAIMRNVQSLDLTIRNKSDKNTPIRLPSNLFTSKTLKKLFLDVRWVVFFASTMSLPNLKHLALFKVKFQDDKILSRLISSCTSLESLIVVKWLNADLSICSSTLQVIRLILCCSSISGHKFAVNTPGLKCLKLSKFGYVDYSFEDLSRLVSSCTSLESLVVETLLKGDLNISSCTLKAIELNLCCRSKININTPALKRLKLSNFGYVDYCFEDLASLEEADVSISPDYCSRVLTNGFQALRHVKSLRVCQNDWEVGVVEHTVEYVLPMFDRLTELDITIDSWRRGYGLFLELIRNSTKLENLVFEVYVDTSGFHYWRNLNSVPPCLISSLRTVSIRSFTGWEDELAMSLYFLENARVMERMEVRFSRKYLPKAIQEKLCKKIMNARRGDDCVVVIFM